jgi:hypothetical protein
MNTANNSENNNQGADDTQQNVIQPFTEQELREAFARQKAEAHHDLAQEVARDDAKREERSWDRDLEGSEIKPASTDPVGDHAVGDLSCFGDSKVEELVQKLEEEPAQKLDKAAPRKPSPARAYKAEPFDREERDKNLAWVRAEQAKEDEKARLARERAKAMKEKNRLAREDAVKAAAAARALARKRKEEKRVYGPKYRPSMSLRDAGLVARYGKFGAHPLAKAALELWHWEPGLAASERELTELVQIIDDLRLMQAFVRRLFKVNAGLAPQVILDRERQRQSVDEALAIALDELAAAAKWREEVRWLHFQAKHRFDTEYKKADRDTRKGLARLKEQWQAGAVKDPMALGLIEAHADFASNLYLRDTLRHEVSYKGGLFDYIIRGKKPALYYAPWIAGFRRLDDPDLQELQLTLRRCHDKKIEEKWAAKAAALGWVLWPEPPEPPVLSCKCGANLPPGRRVCDDCRKPGRNDWRYIEGPDDLIMWGIGKKIEASWQQEDRLDWEAYLALKGEQPEHQSPTTQTDEYGEFRKVFLYHQDVRTRDVADIREAREDAAGWVVFGKDGFHTSLSDLGKGFDDSNLRHDPNDKEV